VILEFTGTITVTTGQSFTAGHDDGLQLQIGGSLVINAPGPTGFVNTTATYTGPSGNLPFDLVYGECCGGPADLAISLPLVTPSVPEPMPLVLLGPAVLGLGVVLRRRRKSA
jgi:MYXO-CTERM domain-containing protein